jgi:hypothetical protein
MRSFKICMAISLCLLCVQALGAADIVVIAHSGTEVAQGDVKDIFLGEKQLAGGTKLQPADNGALQAAFSERVLKMDSAKYGTYWTKKTFRDGVNPPPVKGSDSEVISWVKATPGAVGYVSAAPPDVKTVGKF